MREGGEEKERNVKLQRERRVYNVYICNIIMVHTKYTRTYKKEN